ncbi:hypothetical protein BJF79_14160 [Actinomadura sp. CNU-125]|uniref:TetR/AcrR family transcriptional regulator n=1 Tax=Actinomadura sp. CNU-125 TaxID=1904961 RepID=UPI000965497F|nr:TetR/AcrR family transcriptional regulator [Actinomadura sp. CNU-125]OLT23893.1 hypothetical protein BJF79_14160 [Actinomadura sp. CNU-125]
MTPRGDVRTEAILAAALQVLAEVGYDRLTMEAVAARAQASKATLYRRWPGKAELVVSAVRAHGGDGDGALVPRETGELRGDLVAVLERMRANLEAQDAALLLGLVAAMHRDPVLAETVRDRLVADKGAAFGTVVERAVRRGDVAADVDTALFVELSSAMLFSRLFVTGEPLDAAFVRHLVDAVLIPLLTGGRPAAGPPAGRPTTQGDL